MSAKRVTITLIEDKPTSREEFGRDSYLSDEINDAEYRRYLDRFQPWRWNAKGGNGKILAQGESYFNRGDAIEAIETLFGEHTDAWLRYGDVETRLRAAA